MKNQDNRILVNTFYFRLWYLF